MKRQGFNEEKDPLLGKAKKHHAVALKSKLDKDLISNALEIVPGDEETLDMQFEETEDFLQCVKEFEKKFDVSLQMQHEVNVKVPIGLIDEFMECISEKDIEFKGE